jgi:hypothetical protein
LLARDKRCVYDKQKGRGSHVGCRGLWFAGLFQTGHLKALAPPPCLRLRFAAAALGAIASWSVHEDMPKTTPVAHVDVGDTHAAWTEAGACADVEYM